MRQPQYHEGMGDALARLDTMDESALLGVLDTLYGRDNLKYGDGRDELLAEARVQVRRDFTNMHPDAKADREFYAIVGGTLRRRGAASEER